MKIGLEKEALIFDENFNPRQFKKEELDNNIYLDFANHQLELISDIHSNTFDLVRQMYNLNNEEKISNYNMWPLSQPGIIGSDIKYDALGGKSAKYRKNLAKKYDLNFMTLSGIHYNFDLGNKTLNNKEYYFDFMKKIYEVSPILLQFVSYTPVYQKGIFNFDLPNIGKNVGLEKSLSLRSSLKYGYMNHGSFKLDYTNVQAYEKSKDKAISDGLILSEGEMYTPIRMKESTDGTVYLELRYIDLNPYFRIGISYDILILLEEALKYISTLSSDYVNVEQSLQNFENVALNGQNRSMNIKVNKQENTLENHTVNFLDGLINFVTEEEAKRLKINKENINMNNNKLVHIITTVKEQYKNKTSDFYKFLEEITEKNQTIEEYGKQKSYKKEKFKPIQQSSNMELSTKILIEEAKEEGFEVNIINEDFNFINLKKGKTNENVIQATKTNLDGYATISILENKVLTKDILKLNNVEVPQGYLLKKEKFKIDYSLFEDKQVVVKPMDTNYGEGIVILQENPTREEIDKAVNFAFNYSDYVICEEFFEGTEYRFLVIDNEVVSVIQREPANVVGDGEHNILELINIKNQNPLRGVKYKTPLEKINLGEVEIDYLKTQGYDANTILNPKQKVYLRKNSNVSTGGESEEVLGVHSDYFKEKAIISAKEIEATICGVDMIISDDYNTYKIIEANFNPAIHMHTYPYKGIGTNIAKRILKLLENKK